MIVTALVSGAWGEGEREREATSTSPSRPVAATEPVVGDRVALGEAGGTIAVIAVDPDVQAGRLFTPPRAQQFFAAEVEGCAAASERALLFRPEYFSLRLDGGAAPVGETGVRKPSLRAGTIPAGQGVRGWVTFTIPRGERPVALVYDGSRPVRWSVPTVEAGS